MTALLSVLYITAIAAASSAVEKRLKKIEREYGHSTADRFRYYYKFLDSAKDLPERKLLIEVNDFWNGVRYAGDITVWGKKDYWATPYEFLLRGRGDCEDYVIAKYFTLKKLGIDTKRLYFVYVRVKGYKLPHMVLAYFETPESDPLVLDSLNLKIFRASERKDIIPVYTFNGELLQRFKDRSVEGLGDKNSMVKLKWDDLIERIKKEPL
ncbi:FIGfam010717 [Hydrogenimonas sp.]|nr:FIGfam010717 [Hydrogenimonas sp.]